MLLKLNEYDALWFFALLWNELFALYRTQGRLSLLCLKPRALYRSVPAHCTCIGDRSHQRASVLPVRCSHRSHEAIDRYCCEMNIRSLHKNFADCTSMNQTQYCRITDRLFSAASDQCLEIRYSWLIETTAKLVDRYPQQADDNRSSVAKPATNNAIACGNLGIVRPSPMP